MAEEQKEEAVKAPKREKNLKYVNGKWICYFIISRSGVRVTPKVAINYEALFN